MCSVSRSIRVFLLLLIAAACGGGGEGQGAGSTSDVQGDSAAMSDTGGGVGGLAGLASDGTLTVLTVAPLTQALRTAADSFSAREAVRVLFDTVPALARVSPAPLPNADIIAVSTTTMARLLASDGATWTLPFARNRVVLAWTDSSRRAAEIDSAQWREILRRRDTRSGRADPDRTALGAHTLLAMQLAESHLEDRGLAKRLATARLFPSRDSLLAALRNDALDVIWTYESDARTAGLRWLNLGPQVDLGDDAQATAYAAESTVVHFAPAATEAASQRQGDTSKAQARRDSLVIHGIPLRYALTIPRQSANLALAERFVRFLLSPDGLRILRSGTFDLIDPLVVTGRDVPATVVIMVDTVVVPATDRTDAPVRRP